MSKQTTRVVIVGGGFAGVKAALCLANKPGFSVQLISDNTHFEYHGALYRSAVGHSPMEVVIPLKNILKDAKNVELVLDSAGFIDTKKKRIASTTGNIYPYDAAILALGNQVHYFAIDGIREHTQTMHDIPSTIRLRGALVNLLKEKKRGPIRVTIIGGGPSGVELAGELPAFAKRIAKKYKVKPDIRVVLVESNNRVLPKLKPKASLKALKRLLELGVEVHVSTSVQSCLPDTVCMDSGDLHADLIVWTAGSKPVDFYAKNAPVFTLGRHGQVVVDDYLQAKGKKDLYVLGDNAETPYSGMAQTALYDALFVTQNLKRQKDGKKQKVYRPKSPIYVVTVGPKWAVVQHGGQIISGVRGWLVRRRADLAIFKHFQPYKEAIKTWRQIEKMSKL